MVLYVFELLLVVNIDCFCVVVFMKIWWNVCRLFMLVVLFILVLFMLSVVKL